MLTANGKALLLAAQGECSTGEMCPPLAAM